MLLREVGEFGLIDRIARLARGPRAAHVRRGIGDDAAVLRPRPGEDLVVSTDARIQGVHFRFDQESPRIAGRHAMTAALSDLAASGARPLAVVVALEAPATARLDTVMALLRGLGAAARRHECPWVGGNVTRAPRIGLTLTALGGAPRGRALRRDAARPGDRLLVTGALGATALARLRARREGAPIRRVPEPRLAAGRALAGLRGCGACIDLSDGLLADLGHLLSNSGVGARIEPDRVPRARGLTPACARLGIDPERLVLAGGEDYELLFTVRPGAPPAAALARRLGVPVSEIGRIERRRGLRGAPRGARGWTHF